MTHPTPTVRLLACLLPSTFPDRAGVLRAARHWDAARLGDGSRDLLLQWRRYRRLGVMPADPQAARLVGAIVAILRARGEQPADASTLRDLLGA